jgi:hypothetical protein
MSTATLVQSEKQFQATVIELAQRMRWKTAHFHDSRREVKRRDGTRLVIGDRDAAGFPDFVAVRGPRLVIAEFKAEKGLVKPEQQVWLDALGAVEQETNEWLSIEAPDVGVGVEVYLWRPSDWPEIELVLR